MLWSCLLFSTAEGFFYPFFSLFFLTCAALISFIFFSNRVACQKKLDFRLKVIGGEISSVPGISDALEVCQYINICSR